MSTLLAIPDIGEIKFKANAYNSPTWTDNILSHKEDTVMTFKIRTDTMVHSTCVIITQ